MLSFYKMVKGKSVSAEIAQLLHQEHKQGMSKVIWSHGATSTRCLSTWFLILKMFEEPRSTNKITRLCTHQNTPRNFSTERVLWFLGQPSFRTLTSLRTFSTSCILMWQKFIHMKISRSFESFETALKEAWFMCTTIEICQRLHKLISNGIDAVLKNNWSSCKVLVNQDRLSFLNFASYEYFF